MKTEIFVKFFKQSFCRKLYWTVCVLLVLTALTAWSVSGVYAKYVDAAGAGDSAIVARMGVKQFRLVEHNANDISDDLAKVAQLGTLYELDFTKTVLNNTYSKAIPGVDIPKDPFIELELVSNEVSYELYLRVEESEDFPQHVTYKLADVWKPVMENGKAVSGLYKYVGAVEVDEDEDVDAFVFKAGVSYTPFTYSTNKDSDTSIHILKDDKIKVSEHFNSEPDEEGSKTEFSLKFTAYLQQAINKPTGSDTENGD